MKDALVSFDLTPKDAKLLWEACKCIVDHWGDDKAIKQAQKLQSRLYPIFQQDREKV